MRTKKTFAVFFHGNAKKIGLQISIFLMLILFTNNNANAFGTKHYGLKAIETRMASKSDLPPIDYYIIGGSIGAGVVVSTNIINSGAVLPATIEILLQMKRTRYGFGITNELYLTPENLGKLILGNSSNTKKFFFIMEQTIFKNSPLNLGWSGQLGIFYVGKEMKDQSSDKTRWFVNLGLLLELGHPRYFIFVRPALEYKSYDIGSWHKEVLGTVTLGFRWKTKYTEVSKSK